MSRMPLRRNFVSLLACGLFATATGLRAAPAFDLAALTALLSQVKSGQATFTERRQVAMLDHVLESSGRLSFEAPDTFVRETLKPRPERLAVIGNTLTMSRGDRSRTLALDSAPEAAVLVEAVRGTLTGNRQSLERHFNTTVSGTADRWSLVLQPREFKLRAQVAAFRISGQQTLLREIEVTMPDGDVSTTSIEAVPALSAQPVPAKAQTAPASAASAAAR